MAVLPVLLGLLSLHAAAWERLDEGVVRVEQVGPDDTPLEFKIEFTKEEGKKELSVFFNLFSGSTEPTLCVSRRSAAGLTDCDWTDATSPGYIAIPAATLSSQVELYATVACSGCRYSLVYRYSKPVKLKPGDSLTERTDSGSLLAYTLQRKETSLRVHAVARYGEVDMEVRFTGESLSTEAEQWVQVECLSSWDGGVFALIESEGYYRVTISAAHPVAYELVTLTQSLRPTVEDQGEVAANSMVPGEVAAGQYLRYTLEVTDPKALLTFLLTQYSGDCDLYVSAERPPTMKEYSLKAESVGNEFLFVSEEDRRMLGKATGTYYLAVYGATTGSFALTVRMDGNVAKPLILGLRESGSVKHGKTAHYMVLLPDSSEGYLLLTVSALSGNPDLYAKRCLVRGCKVEKEDIAAPSDGTVHADVYFSRAATTDSVLVPLTRKNCGSPCTVAIGVYGEGEGAARYLLDANLNSTSLISLTSSAPYATWLPVAASLFFKFYEAEENCEALEFVLTPISGNPDLYVSSKVRRPDSSNAEMKSEQQGSLIDKVEYTKTNDRRSLQGTYYLTVSSALPSAFSLSVKERLSTDPETTELLPGLPQEAFCPYQADHEPCIRLFTFYLSPESSDSELKVMVLGVRGSTSLKLTCGRSREPQNGGFRWPLGTDAVSVITAKDRKQCTGNLYTLMAETITAYSEPGRYRVLYTTGESILIGQNWPVTDSVEAGRVNYYRWRLRLPQDAAKLKVETMSGNTENYMSYSSALQRPNATHNTMKWRGFRTVKLDFTDEKVKKQCGGGEYCTVFIGVKGVTNANYTLIAEESTSSPVVLTVGKLLTAATRTTSSHFLAPIGKELPVYVFLQPLNFDVDLYVNIQSESDTVHFPTVESHDFESKNGLLLSESISLSAKAVSDRCSADSCVLAITVHGFTPGSRFDIEVDQSNVPVLLEGKPRQGRVKRDQPLRVRFYCPYDNTTVLVALTRISGGDPDLYISRSVAPTTIEFDWKSTTYGSDYVLISSDDKVIDGKSMRGYYNVAAYATQTSEVSISFSTNLSPPEALVPGVPVFRSTAAKAFSYFYLSVSEPEYDVLVSITPLSGRVALYIHPQNLILEDLYERLPTAANYTWTTGRSSAPADAVLRVSASDPKFCAMACNFVIGVSCLSGNCSYTVAAREDVQLGILQSGVPVRGNVQKGKIDTYAYKLPEGGKAVRATVMGLSGDMDLYVSTKVPLLVEQCFNSSTSASNLEVLDLPEVPADADFLYFGVLGAKAGSYILLLTTDEDRRVRLVQGWGQEYAVRFDAGDYLVFEYSGEEAVCKVRTPGRFFTLNVFALSNSEKGAVPSRTHCDNQYNFTSDEYDEYTNQVSFPLPAGRHAISVYGGDSKRHGSEQFRVFTLYCSEGQDAVRLKAGAEDYETLTSDHMAQSYILETPQEGILEAYLSTCSGKTQLSGTNSETGAPLPVMQVDKAQAIVLTSKDESVRIGVKMQEADPDLAAATYHLATRFTRAGDSVPQAILPGRDGLLHVESGSGAVKLQWTAPVYQGGGKVEPSAVVYRVYAAFDPDVALQSFCGIHVAARQHRVRKLSHDDLTETHFEFESPNSPSMYLTVIAFLSLPDYTHYFSYVHYDVVKVETEWQEAESSWVRYVGWALVAVLVVCLAAAIKAQMRKRRQSRSESEYEMMGARS